MQRPNDIRRGEDALPVSLMLTIRLRNGLREAARAEERSQSEIVRTALEVHLRRLGVEF